MIDRLPAPLFLAPLLAALLAAPGPAAAQANGNARQATVEAA